VKGEYLEGRRYWTDVKGALTQPILLGSNSTTALRA
jgi:hypothetical protein